MGKRVTIAYEKPQRRRKTVEAVAVTKVEAFRAEVVRCEHGAPEGASCGACLQKRSGPMPVFYPGPGGVPIAGPFYIVAGHPSPHAPSEARDSGAAFTQVTRDPRKFEQAMARAKAIGPIDTDTQLHRFLREDLESQDQEVFLVCGFDLNGDLRLYSEVARGQRDRVAVTPADILRPVIIEGCQAFAVAHNHPSGNAEPSEQDKVLTEKLREATVPFGGSPVFLDHLVVGSAGSYYSFADKRLKKG